MNIDSELANVRLGCYEVSKDTDRTVLASIGLRTERLVCRQQSLTRLNATGKPGGRLAAVSLSDPGPFRASNSRPLTHQANKLHRDLQAT